jgi:hypothetical protein
MKKESLFSWVDYNVFAGNRAIKNLFFGQCIQGPTYVELDLYLPYAGGMKME